MSSRLFSLFGFIFDGGTSIFSRAILLAAENVSVYFCIYIFKTQNVNENKVMFLFIIDSKGCEGEVSAESKSLHSLKIMNSNSASVPI